MKSALCTTARGKGKCNAQWLSYPHLFPLSESPAEILCWDARGASGTMHCIMKQVDPVQPILLGKGVRGCRNCMLSITKQRMLISIRVYSELSVTIEIKCISSKQMTWKKIHFFWIRDATQCFSRKMPGDAFPSGTASVGVAVFVVSALERGKWYLLSD